MPVFLKETVAAGTYIAVRSAIAATDGIMILRSSFRYINAKPAARRGQNASETGYA